MNGRRRRGRDLLRSRRCARSRRARGPARRRALRSSSACATAAPPAPLELDRRHRALQRRRDLPPALPPGPRRWSTITSTTPSMPLGGFDLRLREPAPGRGGRSHPAVEHARNHHVAAVDLAPGDDRLQVDRCLGAADARELPRAIHRVARRRAADLPASAVMMLASSPGQLRIGDRAPSDETKPPLSSRTEAALTPRRSAARSRSVSRSRAAAWETGSKQLFMLRLPAVTITGGIWCVSGETTSIAANSTFSSSATTCARPVRIPCPISLFGL